MNERMPLQRVKAMAGRISRTRPSQTLSLQLFSFPPLSSRTFVRSIFFLSLSLSLALALSSFSALFLSPVSLCMFWLPYQKHTQQRERVNTTLKVFNFGFAPRFLFYLQILPFLELLASVTIELDWKVYFNCLLLMEWLLLITYYLLPQKLDLSIH